MTESGRAYWDAQAADFDREPDHGLLDAGTREAWRELLHEHLPPAPSDVVDLGCGTGSLSVLLAQAGYRVRGLDLSDRMVEAARDKAKAADVNVVASFEQGDASRPPFAPASCDVVLVRHVLWTMADPGAALVAWIGLLRPGGRLVLVEGSWSTGAGISAAECESLVRLHRTSVVVVPLVDDALWGRPIDDERYLVVSTG